MSENASNTDSAGSVRRWEAPCYESQGSGPLTAASLAAIEQRAYEEGRQRGLEEGQREGFGLVQAQAQRLEQLVGALEPQSAILDESLLTQIAELVLVLVRQLVRRELNRDPGDVVRVVRESIAALPVAEAEIRICVHPGDVELLQTALAAEQATQRVRFVEDPAISRGGARVESDVSVVDATVEARLGAIAASVFGDERQEPLEENDE